MAKAGGPRVLVNGGAVGHYGERGDEVLTEGSSRGGGFLAEVVEAWEREAFRAQDAGVRVASLRTGIDLGPKGGALKPLELLFNFGLGGPVGSGNQWWPWVHGDDVAGAIAGRVNSNKLASVASTLPIRRRGLPECTTARLHVVGWAAADGRASGAVSRCKGWCVDEGRTVLRVAESRSA